MNNILESHLAKLNADIFYREFSFSRNDFTPIQGKTKEFADHIVWIDDLLIIYQLKERNINKETSDKSERNWFERKVLGVATKQVRDTLQFLQDYPEINIQNQRGHLFNVNSQSLNHLIKLIIYDPNPKLPESCLRIRHHISSTAGFLHIITWSDYIGVCSILLTPAELIEYFEFREKIIQRWESVPSEPALVGQFLLGDYDVQPNEEYVKYLKGLQTNNSDFDISYILDGIGDHIDYYEGKDEIDYYKILAEFAKLDRVYLKEVKKRIIKCLEAVKENEFMSPTRIIVPKNNCGFLFIPIEKELLEQRVNGLKNLTYAAKYEQRLQCQVGISFAKKEDNLFIDWALLDNPWEYDSNMEKLLRDKNPFRPVKPEVRYRYEFKD